LPPATAAGFSLFQRISPATFRAKAELCRIDKYADPLTGIFIEKGKGITAQIDDLCQPPSLRLCEPRNPNVKGHKTQERAVSTSLERNTMGLAF